MTTTKRTAHDTTNRPAPSEQTLTRLALEVNWGHHMACQSTANGLDQARRAGIALIEAKEQLSHGQWLEWLETRCPFVGVRTAQAYMVLARFWTPVIDAARDAKSSTYLSLAEALQLIRESRRQSPRGARPDKASLEELSADEQREVRRLYAEMAEFPFISRTFTPAGARRGGDVVVVGGAAGSGCYWDIVGGNADAGQPIFRYSRADVVRNLSKFLDGRGRSVVSDLIVDVAKRRLQGDRSLRPASLPPEAGDEHVCILTGSQAEREAFSQLLRRVVRQMGIEAADEFCAVMLVLTRVVENDDLQPEAGEAAYP